MQDVVFRDRPREMAILVANLVQRDEPLVLLLGRHGCGKTALAQVFEYRYSSAFDGGISWLRPSENLEAQLANLTLRSTRDRTLAIIDDASYVSSRDFRGAVAWALRSNGKLSILALGRSDEFAKPYAAAPRVVLQDLFSETIFEAIAKNRAQGGEPGFIGEDIENIPMTEFIRQYESGEWADKHYGPISPGSFYRTGLIDPNGEPLSTNSSAGQQLILDARSVDRALLTELRKNPEIAYSLPSRKWEELVARFYSERGYQVELTSPSKDGGRDIQIVRKDHLGSAMIFVECKRYAKDRPVGVEIVKQLFGTVMMERATQGVVVTTSNFTEGARKIERKHERQLSLAGYEKFLEWLREAGY